jgi:FixJ family two-component response regulator
MANVKQRIAIIDDNVSLNDSLAYHLEAAGYEALAFTSGEEFLQVFT